MTADDTNAESGLNRLINNLERVRNATQRLSGENSKCTQTTDRLRKSTERATTAQKSLTTRLAASAAKVYVLYMALNTVAQKLAQAYNASNDYIEALNLFRVTMRDGTDQALEFANSVQELMGINISEWINYQGKFKQLASGFGVVNDQADVMSQNLTQLSYDLASFFNVSTEKAFDKLSSAMTGQVKGLREFGIDTSIASLQEYALAKGIDLSVRKMTQAQKAVLRYNYILEKSVSIHGDLARTITTPANALRVLNAQMERAQRAIGNIISVVVTRFIPYIQAAVMLIEYWANSLAEAWGFELPEIDYSNLDYAATITEEIDEATAEIPDNISDAATAAKKLKLQLMGFDELNILKSPAEDTASALEDIADTVANNYPSDLGLGVPEYDFGLDTVSSQAKGIFRQLKDYFDNLTPAKLVEDLLTFSWNALIEGAKLFVEALKGVWNWFWKLDTRSQQLLATIAAIFAIKKISNFINAFKGLSTVSKYLTAFKSGWITSFGETPFKRFMSGIKEARNSLSTFEKAAIVTVATIFAAFASKDFFYKFKTDTLDAKSAIIDVAGSVASLGASFAAGGWIGLAITALGMLAGAIEGVSKASQEMTQELINNALYDGGTVSITQLTETFTTSMDKIKEEYDKYSEAFTGINESSDKVNGTISTLDSLYSAFQNGALSAEDACKRIGEAMKQLPDQVKESNSAYYNAVYKTLYSPFGKALEDAGMSKARILGLTGDLIGELNTKADTINEAILKLEEQHTKGIVSNSDYLEQMNEYRKKLDRLIIQPTTETSTQLASLQQQMNEFDFSNINWEDESTWKSRVDDITESVKGAKDSINNYYNEVKATWVGLRDTAEREYGKNSDAYKLYEGLVSTTENERNAKITEINNQVNDFYTQIGNNAVSKMSGLSEKLKDKWKEVDFFTKWLGYGYDENEYLRKGLIDYQSSTLRNIDKVLQSSMNAVNSGGKSIAEYTATSILQMYSNLNGDSNDLSDALDWINENIAAANEQALNRANGFTRKLAEASRPTEWMKTQIKTDYNQMGLDATTSYANAITRSANLVVSAVESINSGVSNAFSGVKGVIDDMFNSTLNETTWANKAIGISGAFARNFSLPNYSLVSEGLSSGIGIAGGIISGLKWRTYATGGFPEMGEMFIAREQGAEMVGRINGRTAVANNDQITEGIARAVYSAFTEASGSDNRIIQIRIPVEVSGEAIGEAAVEYHNNEVIRTGVSPLKV